MLTDQSASRLLELVRDALKPLVEGKLSPVSVAPARPYKGKTSDVYALLTFVTGNPGLFRELNKKALNCAHEILTDRNAAAHQEPVDVRRLADTVAIFVKALGRPELLPGVSVDTPDPALATKPTRIAAQWPELTIVTCAAKKRRSSARADELYDPSLLFRLCVEQVKRDGRPWLIVSSEYGLVEPEREIKPYKQDIKSWSAEKKRSWRNLLSTHAATIVERHGVKRVWMLAGADYRASVADAFSQSKVASAVHPEWNRIYKAAFA